MLYGAFPDYIFKNIYDPQLFKSLLLEVFEKDLKFEIDFIKFLDVLKLLAYQEYMIKTINTISESIGLNYRTVKKNIEWVEKNVYRKHNLQSSLYKRKSKFKVYFIDRGLRNSILTDFFRNIERIIKIDRDFYSSNSEALVLNSLYRILYKLGIEEPDIRFWLDKNKEIDFYYKSLKL